MNTADMFTLKGYEFNISTFNHIQHFQNTALKPTMFNCIVF
jgi:hypothetical protein